MQTFELVQVFGPCLPPVADYKIDAAKVYLTIDAPSCDEIYAEAGDNWAQVTPSHRR